MTLVAYVLLCRYCSLPVVITVQTKTPQQTGFPGSCMRKFNVWATTITLNLQQLLLTSLTLILVNP